MKERMFSEVKKKKEIMMEKKMNPKDVPKKYASFEEPEDYLNKLKIGQGDSTTSVPQEEDSIKCNIDMTPNYTVTSLDKESIEGKLKSHKMIEKTDLRKTQPIMSPCYYEERLSEILNMKSYESKRYQFDAWKFRRDSSQ